MAAARLAALLTALALLTGVCRSAEPPLSPRLLTPDDYYRVRTVSDPHLSPDGQWIAYVVASNDRSADEARSAIWMASWDGRQQLPLTQPAKGTHAPRFSPDGRYLSYLATAPGSQSAQLMLLDRRGGEPRALTNLVGDLGEYAWSPDARRIVLVMDGSSQEATKPPRSDATDPSPQPFVISALHFKQDEDGYLANGHDRHLFLLDVQSGALTALTQDPAYEDDLPAWSPDGRRIAFVRTRERAQDPDGRVQLTLIDAQPGASAQLLARPYAPNTQRLAFSPDGGHLAYLAGEEPRYNQYIQDHLLVVPLAGGEPRDLSATLDRAVISYDYAPDGRSITALIEDDGVSYPARIDLASGAIKALSHGPYVVAALTQAGGHSALLYAEEFRAMDVAALEEGGPRPLDAQNAQLFAQIQFATVQEIAYRSRDGAEVHGRIIRPPGFVPGRKYPAVVWIHGGPNSQDMHAMDFDDDSFKWQLLAARGFIVLAVNYRGSSGRGSAYTKAIFADWGHKDLEDVLAGVDKLVALREVDPARLGIGGWSYGAILTDFAIAKDGRFKAAFSGAGTANPLALYGSDEYIMQYNNELGPPWRDTARWLRLSYPLLHADRIHTPTLFMGGTLDFDVPINGGEQMYEALRTLGVPTQLVIYPGQYHTLTRPSFRKDRMERVTDWFTRYLDPAP